MAVPQYRDATADVERNILPPHQVAKNQDPALESAHHHHHGHVHHDAQSEKNREDEVVYSKGTTFENSTIPDQVPQDHGLHRNKTIRQGDIEVVDPQSHKVSEFYVKYRIFFHLFIWLFFTG